METQILLLQMSKELPNNLVILVTVIEVPEGGKIYKNLLNPKIRRE